MKVVELSKTKEEIVLDLKIGELCVTDKKELVFRNKERSSDKTDRKQEIIKAIKEADDSYINIRENPATSFDVNRIASDILSMHSGSSYYVSVKTPRTKTRSVISSKMQRNGSKKRGEQWSFFKKQSNQSDMNKTTHQSLSKSSKKSHKRISTTLSNSRSQRSGIADPIKLFTNNCIIDKINDMSSESAYGTYDHRASPAIVKPTPNKEKLPYPYLSAFINKHSGGVHFGKRMKLQGLQTTKEIAEEQFKQMKAKELQRLEEKANLKMQEYQEMLNVRDFDIF